MNDKRTSYKFPAGHEIRITGNYLVGLLEGDGCFYLNKSHMTVRISLATTTKNRVLLDKIGDFLKSQLDKFSYILASHTKLMNVNNKKRIGDSQPISIFEIYQIDYICNILIPYLDKIPFRTKKHRDYLDFRTIAFLLLHGKHLTKEGKKLICMLGDTMNNNRLSTNSNPLTLNVFTSSKLDSLIKSNPLIKIDYQGRAFIKEENKYIRSTYIIEVTLPDYTISYFPNGTSCAEALKVSNNTITQRLNDGKPVKNTKGSISALKIIRMRAYSPKDSA
jgi:hypothetical protein